MLGGNVGNSDNWTSVGVINSYANTRVRQGTDDGQPVLPSMVDVLQDPLMNVFDASTEEQLNEVITLLDDDNDQVPYDRDLYVGQSVNHLGNVCRLVTTSFTGRVAMSRGVCAPLGLIAIDAPSGEGVMDSQNNFRIVIDVAIGTYQGVYAERM